MCVRVFGQRNRYARFRNEYAVFKNPYAHVKNAYANTKNAWEEPENTCTQLIDLQSQFGKWHSGFGVG
jgi:hypothetical protein